MEKGGQYQRLLLALLVLVGELGAWLLLGALALSVVLSQVMVLLLACFSPVALVAGVVPGRGHDLFRVWASQLTTSWCARRPTRSSSPILLAVLAALQDAASDLGWLMSFGLQTALTWTVFLQRHRLAGQLGAAISGQHPEREAQLRRLLGLGYARRLVNPARRPPTPTSPPRSGDADAGRPQQAHAAWAGATEVPTRPPARYGPGGPDPERTQHHPHTARPAPSEGERLPGAPPAPAPEIAPDEGREAAPPRPPRPSPTRHQRLAERDSAHRGEPVAAPGRVARVDPPTRSGRPSAGRAGPGPARAT